MKKFTFILIAMMAMIVSCKQETAEEAAKSQTTEEKEALTGTPDEELSAMRLGIELAQYGYENESPEALIEAANILAGVSTQELQAEIEKGEATQIGFEYVVDGNELQTEIEEGEATGEQSEKTTEERSFDPADLLAKARELAGDDANLLAMIKKVEDRMAETTEGKRGTTHPGSLPTVITRVDAHSYDIYTIECQAGQVAECAIVGDGDTDLDLYVYDENGNLITSDTDYTDRCYCRWTPRWTGNFRLKIINRGNVYNQYTIAVN